MQDWNVYIASHPGAYAAPFLVGDTLCAQGRFRDPPAPKTTNLSDGLEVCAHSVSVRSAAA